MRSRRSPVRVDGSWRLGSLGSSRLGLDGPLPCGIGRLTVSGRGFAPADILVRPHPQGRFPAAPAQERLLTERQASLDATYGAGPKGRVARPEGGGPSGL
ncbi:hypothetical protein AB0E04_44670 [Streptomyces sp. NPDC048251]|uniref:hypothetical protein n=1 Tax=Streptomyces sp. NPDC048251 TaxID=3154501 RepID=UPI003429A561